MVTSKSNTGSFASEIEKRLQSLEEKAHTPCGGGGASVPEDLAAKFEELWGWYQSVKSKV